MADLGRSGSPRRWTLGQSGSEPYISEGPSVGHDEYVEVVEAAAYDRLAEAVQRHLDTFGYDNHEGLADALAGPEEN